MDREGGGGLDELPKTTQTDILTKLMIRLWLKSIFFNYSSVFSQLYCALWYYQVLFIRLNAQLEGSRKI